MDWVFYKDLLIGTSAIVGIALGLYNLIHSRGREKVKLEIIPKSVMNERVNTENGQKIYMVADNDFSNSHSLFGFEIINKSDFPVVIEEFGLIKKGKESRLLFPIPILMDKGGWPRELKPRNSMIAYCLLQNIIDSAKKYKIKRAYVKTSCNRICYGSSKALELLKKYAKENV